MRNFLGSIHCGLNSSIPILLGAMAGTHIGGTLAFLTGHDADGLRGVFGFLAALVAAVYFRSKPS